MRMIFALFLILAVGFPATAGPLDESELFRPDVYPSKSSAVVGLAGAAAHAMLGSEEFCTSTNKLVLQGTAGVEELRALSAALSAQIPELRIELFLDRAPSAQDKGAVLATLALAETEVPNPVKPGPTLHKGTLTLSLTGAPMQQAFTERFVDKPWADDWDSFVNSQPKGRWIRADSDAFDVTEGAALDEARKVASGSLWPRVRDRMNARNAGRTGAIKVSEQWVRTRLESLLKQDRFIRDRFVPGFERPYGKVWQASLLVDASADSIDEMASHCARLARAEFGAKAVTLGSMAGMVGVIVLLYLFVNAVTKGYFVWRLRAAALLLGIAGILIVLAVR